MELPDPTVQALWVLYVLERTVLRCKQKWVSYQVFKIVGAWSTANGNDGTPWMSQLGHLENKARRCKYVDLYR